MKIKDLKEAIKDLDDDLAVFVFADHSQQPEHCDDIDGEGKYIINELELIHPDDVDNWDSSDIADCVVLYGN